MNIYEIANRLANIDCVMELNGAGLNKLDWRWWRTSGPSNPQALIAARLRKYRKQLSEAEMDIIESMAPPLGIPSIHLDGALAQIKAGGPIVPRAMFQKYLDTAKQLGGKFQSATKQWLIAPAHLDQFTEQMSDAGFDIIYASQDAATAEANRAKAEKTFAAINEEARCVKLDYDEGTIKIKHSYDKVLTDLLSNKNSQISGITEYLPEEKCRATNSFALAEEIAKKIRELGFPQKYTKDYDEAKAKTERLIKESEKPLQGLPMAPQYSMMSHQNRAVRFVENAGGSALLGACMGCIDGDAIVTVNRAGKSFRISLRALHEKFQGGETGRWGKGYKWDLSIPTTIRCFFNGEFRSMPVQQTYARGVKPTVKLILADGKALIATPDHPILSTDGWVRADECARKSIVCNGISSCKKCGSTENVVTYQYAKNLGICKRCVNEENAKKRLKDSVLGSDGYKYVRVSKHPFAPKSRGSNGIGQHRLVIEADLNGVSYEDWVNICRECNDLSGYNFISKACHVHHKNGDKLDNRLENLEMYDAKVHLELHATIETLPIFKPKFVECVSVEPYNEIEVFDVHVPFAENFVANGMVVHNSGKTLMALAYAARNNLRTLVVCPKVVRRTWIQEAQKFFPSLYTKQTTMELNRKTKGFSIPSTTQIVSVNYEGLSKFSEAIGATNWDLLILDESHLIKDAKSKRCQEVSLLASRIKRKVLLSGTAIKNNREELAPQLELIAPYLYGSAGEIRRESIGRFWHQISLVYLSMPKSEVLSFLPAKLTQQIAFDVDAPVGLPDSIEKITAYKVACAKSKIDSTIEKLNDILENSDEKILVFSESMDVVEALYDAFKPQAILHHGQLSDEKREQAKSKFQHPECPQRLFISTRQSLAVGATLTAASTVVFNDLPWTAADIQQAEDRTHRIGQERNVNVFWVIAGNSEFDSRITDIIRQKYIIQKAVTEGKQVSPEEREFLDKQISFKDIIAKPREVRSK